MALVFWGPWVLNSPGSTILAANDIDPSALMWFLSWWPHALLHGLNPFYTEVIFVPEGYNLAWVTSMPGLSLVLAPVTLSLGPEVSWNLISFAAPVLSAWTAFLLCRHLTGKMAPSLVGGYIFGFSPYMLGHLSGAPHLAFVALLPVFLLLVLRHLRGTLSDRTFTIAMIAALTAEILISTEVLATAVLFGTLAMATGYLLYPELRGALRRTGLLVGLSLAGTAVLASPLLYYVFFRERTLPDHALEAFPADLLAFVVPGSILAASPEQLGRTAPDWASSSPYIGLPLLFLVAVFAWTHWRSRLARLGVVMFLLAALAALGKALQVGGEDSGLPLPWAGFAELPLLRYALPIRFSLFVFLAAAVIVALWLAWRPGAGRWLLALLVVGSLLPSLGNAAWHTRLPEVAFFEAGHHEEFLDEDDRVLTVPVWGKNMRWHLQAGFSFQLASGYVGAFPKSYVRYPAWTALLAGSWSSPSEPASTNRLAQLRRFVADKGVTDIVAERNAPGPLRRLFAELGGRPVSTGGVLLYRLSPASVLGANLSVQFSSEHIRW